MATSLPGLSRRTDSVTFKLTLIRHGETKENKLSIIQGQTDTKLSEEGIFQAKRLANRLSRDKYRLVVCSPLRRAQETAKHGLALNRFEYDIKLDGRLMERAFGKWEGVKVGETHSVPKIGVETLPDLFLRVKLFMKDLCVFVATKCEISPETDTSNPIHILVVTHGGVIASVLKLFKDDFKLEVLSAKEKMIQNTSVTTFLVKVRKDASAKIMSVKCFVDRDTSHLAVGSSHI